MATLTTAAITPAGTDPAFVAATGAGDKVVPGDTTYLHVKNASGVSVTVTVTAVGLCSQGSTHNSVVVVPTVSDRIIGRSARGSPLPQTGWRRSLTARLPPLPWRPADCEQADRRGQA